LREYLSDLGPARILDKSSDLFSPKNLMSK